MELNINSKDIYVLDPQDTSEKLEFSVSLFENCNLNCKFCFSKHKHFNIDPKSIDKVVDVCIKYLDDYGIDLNSKTDIMIHTWGGELFADNVKDEMFDAYVKYCTDFHDALMKKNPTLDIHFDFLSNGVFTKRERVVQFLDKVADVIKGHHSHHLHGSKPVRLGFSYDPVDRFNTLQQKELWYSNIQYFKDYLNAISITLTKRNIDLIVEGDEYFKKCMHLEIDTNYYWANTNWEQHLPSDDDYFKFYKWAVDNTLNCNIVKQAIISTVQPQRSCECANTVQYLGGSCTRDCVLRTSNQCPSKFYGKYKDCANEFTCTDLKKNVYIEKRGCMDCPNFSFCIMGCVGSMCFEEFKPYDCHLKRFYEYIKDKPELLEWARGNTKDIDE